MIQDALLIVVGALAVAHILRQTLYGKRTEAFVDLHPFVSTPEAEKKEEEMGPDGIHPSMSPDTEDDPRDLPWIASWSPADQYARRGQNCVPTYTESGPDGTTILTTKTCEEGLPHTRVGDRIVIPDSVLFTDRASIIQHEMVHIYQRRYPKEWSDFYRRNWMFTLHTTPPKEMPKNLQEARRSNPDTWDPIMGGPWSCWMGRWWPVPIYRNPKTPTLRDAVTVWWDSWKQETLTCAPDGWVAFFGTPAQDEHPHELAAVMIAKEDTQGEAGRRLHQWWETARYRMKGLSRTAAA